MQIKILLLFAFCGLAVGDAYKIPKVKLDILSEGFRVSIPDQTGISKVLYTIKIDEKCPAIMNNVTAPQNESWASVHDKTKLNPNNMLTIFLMVEYNNEVYKAKEVIKLDNNLVPHGVKSTEAVNLSKHYEINSCEIQPEEINECIPAVTAVRNVGKLCKGNLIFEETFSDQRRLNTSRWSYDIRMLLGVINEEFALFDDKEENLFIENDILNIVPTVRDQITRGNITLGDRCTAKSVINWNGNQCNVVAGNKLKFLTPTISALINTKESFNFKYGRVEIRAKLPKGDWILPYIMLQDVAKYSDDPTAHQIRIAFARGNDQLKDSSNEEIGGTHLYGGIVFYRINGMRFEDTRDYKSERHFGEDFHTYELTWTPTKITVAVDGNKYGEIDKSVDNEVFDLEQYLILGVSVGGHREFPDMDSKPWRNASPLAVSEFFRKKNIWEKTWKEDKALKVDYVKVFAV